MVFHSKEKGAIAELAVMLHLTKNGYACFKQAITDLSSIDIFAEKDKKYCRIQVKYVNSSNDIIKINTRTCGPGYNRLYTKDEFDYFAYYVADKDDILFVSFDDIVGKSLTIRYSETKNNQKKNVSHAKDYRGLPKLFEIK